MATLWVSFSGIILLVPLQLRLKFKENRMTDRTEEPVEQEDTVLQNFVRYGDIKIGVESFDYLIGKLFTHTELLGLPERQHAAYKATVRAMFWDWYNSHMENEMGFADPSHQYRVEAGIDK